MKTILIAIAFVFLISCPVTQGRRGGGGSRGGGSRGGGSSRSSSSRGSSSSSSYSSSRYSYGSSSKSSAPKPSAPALPKAVNYPVQPSAPRAPVHSSPNQQPAYNPYYRPQNPPPYPNKSPGTNMGPPPPYMNQPPPYPGGNPRPPPYDFNRGRPGSSAYPRQPGYANAPYPRQPGSVNAPYPRQPGSAPYSGTEWIRQPGISIERPPVYAQRSGLPMAGNSYTKPYKKKGFLGQILSSGGIGSSRYKAPKPYGSAAGGFSHFGAGRSGISPAMYPIMPLVMKSKIKRPSMFGFGRPSFIFLPRPHYHHHGYWHQYHGPQYGIEHESYLGRCKKPFTPDHALIECNTTEQGAKCRVSCKDGYRFSDNATFKENECWHIGGVWKPSRDFPRCEPICKDECQNGGKCVLADVCSCPPSYRGRVCEYHILKCDVRKIPGVQDNKIGWSCHHSKNGTVCKIRCRDDTENFLEKINDSKTYHCTVEGKWTPESVPPCDNGDMKDTTSVAETETVNLEAKIE